MTTSALAKVKAAIAAVKPELDPLVVTPHARLVKDLGIDSLKLAELSLALEDVFEHPIHLGEVLADAEDPAEMTVADLAARLDAGS